MITKFSKIVKQLYIWIVLSFTKINPRIIVFSSLPDYSDNSRALSDYMVANGYLAKYDIYWAVKDAKKYALQFPDSKIKFITNTGFKKLVNYPLFLSASWIFGTHDLVYSSSEHKKEQHIINLWHGCSYKDKDATLNKQKTKPGFDKALVAGPLFVDTKSYFWNCEKDRILAKGYPRYDWLLNETTEANRLLESLKGCNSKLLIWMPTYRNDKSGRYNDTDSIKQFPLLHDRRLWLELDRFCQSKKVVIAVKLHPFQSEYPIPWNEFVNIKRLDTFDFEQYQTSLYNFLKVTDGLITDYSSVAVDYMIVDKPIAFTLDDFQEYKEGRGFVIKNVLDYMPGHHLFNFSQLLEFISDLSNGNDSYKEERHSLFGVLVHKSDCYCKEIIEEFGL